MGKMENEMTAIPATAVASCTTCVEEIVPGFSELREGRQETVREAHKLGADVATLTKLATALRVHRRSEVVVLPSHRLESKSRGRGWARKGRGNNVEWGERVEGGYACGPGRWTVGATDGYSRKGSDEWVVECVEVGPEIWTVAS